MSSLQFLGVLASDLRHPSRRLVLQRAQGRLAYATRDEIRLFFSLYVLSRTPERYMSVLLMRAVISGRRIQI